MRRSYPWLGERWAAARRQIQGLARAWGSVPAKGEGKGREAVDVLVEPRKKARRRRAGAPEHTTDMVPLEQYRITFDVIIGLNDIALKSVLTIFVVYAAITAFVIQGISNGVPQVKNMLFLNYVLIFVFFYYLGYVRFRIRTMFRLAKEIEEGESFKYRSIERYEELTNKRFFSTAGLFAVIICILVAFNTTLLVIL